MATKLVVAGIVAGRSNCIITDSFSSGDNLLDTCQLYKLIEGFSFLNFHGIH